MKKFHKRAAVFLTAATLIFQMNQKLKFLQIQWNRHRKMQEMM